MCVTINKQVFKAVDTIGNYSKYLLAYNITW